MNLIRKVEIVKFRSIYKQTISLGDLSVFSGKNNSGKSNVLKALNLFFNTESSFKTPYDHAKDYNIAYTGQAGGPREIVIKLHFHPTGTGALRFDFAISRSFRLGSGPGEFQYHSDNEGIQKKITDGDGNVRRQFTTFLNKIKYIYVPAVRDKEFVAEMMLMFENLLEDDKGLQFKRNIKSLSDILESKSQDISEDFNKFIGLSATASLSTSIRDVLSAARIYVETGIKTQRIKGEARTYIEKVDLFSSGDGILMSYIPHFLVHVFGKISNKNFILGFEEPENSLEYAKVQALAESFFSEFSLSAQILVTTHSPAFIKLRESEEERIKFYRVYILPDDLTQASQIKEIEEIERRQRLLFDSGTVFSEEYRKLSDELNFVEQAKEVEGYLHKLIEEQKNLEKERTEIKTRLEADYKGREYPQKIFLCEDSNKKAVKFWEKMFNLWGISEVKIRSTGGCTKFHQEDVFCDKTKEMKGYNPKIFRQIDRDSLSDEQIEIYVDFAEERAKKEYASMQYKFVPLPVNEIENFFVISNPERFDDEFWDTHERALTDEFDKNAEAQIRSIHNKLHKHSKLGEFKDTQELIQKMRNLALENKPLYLPGKDICKLIPGCSPIPALQKKRKHDLPRELDEYMGSVKEFFED